jgi:hypothetical protein
MATVIIRVKATNSQYDGVIAPGYKTVTLAEAPAQGVAYSYTVTLLSGWWYGPEELWGQGGVDLSNTEHTLTYLETVDCSYDGSGQLRPRYKKSLSYGGYIDFYPAMTSLTSALNYLVLYNPYYNASAWVYGPQNAYINLPTIELPYNMSSANHHSLARNNEFTVSSGYAIVTGRVLGYGF